MIPGDVPRLRVDVVSDEPSFLALEHTWHHAIERSAHRTPFLSFDWMRTWWEAFGRRYHLHVVVLRDGSETVGIAPLMFSGIHLFGLNLRRLTLLHNAHTPCSDVIVTSQAERVYATLADHLAEQRRHVDVVELPQLVTASPTATALRSYAQGRGWHCGIWRPSPERLRHLRDDWDGLLAALPRKHRCNLRNAMRHLERHGRVALEQVHGGSPLTAALHDGLRIEAASWKGSAGTAITSCAMERGFYTRLAERSAARGWLRLLFLTLNGQRIAFAYALSLHGTLYLLKLGYDPVFARCSPAHLLCLFILHNAIMEKYRTVEFLGDDEPWKRLWSDAIQPHQWLYLFPNRIDAWLLCRAKFGVAPRLRWLRKAWS